jgi:ubiquinone biosynthesis protein Coq4
VAIETISSAFGRQLLRTFNDPSENPVHVLFNQWWREAPDKVKQGYVDALMGDEALAPLATGQHYAEPLDLRELARCAPGSLGRTYHDWIVSNGLESNLATNYRAFHDGLERAGALDGMPAQLRFAVLRGFQTHDFQHVVTGYDSSGWGEIALQAFCLAQIRFPYFGMWMSVVTTRMTFADPESITPMMDAISRGWQAGRSVDNIQAVQWEELLDVPLDEIRARFSIGRAGTRGAPHSSTD